MASEDVKLANCPFCGSDKIVIGADGFGYDVRCFYYGTGCKSRTGTWDTRDEAVAAWNRRAAQPVASAAPGDNAELVNTVRNARALLALDEKDALAPHGIGGLAREAITSLLDAIAALQQESPMAEDDTTMVVSKEFYEAAIGLIPYHIVRPPTPDDEAVKVCNGDLRKLSEAYEQDAILAHPLHQPAPDVGTIVAWRYRWGGDEAWTLSHRRPNIKSETLEAQPLYVAPAPEPQAPATDGVTDEVVEKAIAAYDRIYKVEFPARGSWVTNHRDAMRAALTAANERSR